jgi:transcriptional regulator with XRE-family HTH domain
MNASFFSLDEAGPFFKKLRKSRGLTMVAAAAELESSITLIAGFESGRSFPNKANLQRMSELYGVDLCLCVVHNKEDFKRLIAAQEYEDEKK